MAAAARTGGIAGSARHGTLRALLLAILVLGLVGTGIELLLLEHTASVWQWIPVGLVPLGLVVTALFWRWPGVATIRAFQVVMALLVIAGGVGLILHYKGNVEFEREMAPTLGGWALFRKSMMGATPALAPGSMAQLGLIGLAATYRHPSRARR